MVNHKMDNLDDIIRYETESTYVDFKEIPFLPYKEKKVDLIKDVLSMANADVEGDRYIIIGVDFDNQNQRILVGVDQSVIPDPADYQQLIHENIFPDVMLDVFCHPLDDKVFGIIKIRPCDDGPYEMRKDFGPLKKGDRWIRKGTFQTPILREDLDRIYNKRNSRSRFTGEIKISFDENGSQEAVFSAIGDYLKPSDYHKWKIEKALELKRNPPPPKDHSSVAARMQSIAEGYSLSNLMNPFDYNRSSIEELEEKLSTVRDDHKEADQYELFEKQGQQLHLTIANNSNQYLVDTRLTLEIPRYGICVAEQVYDEPSSGMLLPIASPYSIRWKVNNYPSVEYTESFIKITKKIGDVPHLIPTEVFIIPPRIAFSKNLIGATIEAKCTIHARNLETTYDQLLTIRIAEPVDEEDDSADETVGE